MILVSKLPSEINKIMKGSRDKVASGLETLVPILTYAKHSVLMMLSCRNEYIASTIMGKLETRLRPNRDIIA